jgi:hypothetical protein
MAVADAGMRVVALSEGPCAGAGAEGDAERGVAVLAGASPGEMWLAHTSPDGAVGPLLRRIDADCPQMSAMLATTDSAQGVFAVGCRAHAGAELVRARCGSWVCAAALPGRGGRAGGDVVLSARLAVVVVGRSGGGGVQLFIR